MAPEISTDAKALEHAQAGAHMRMRHVVLARRHLSRAAWFSKSLMVSAVLALAACSSEAPEMSAPDKPPSQSETASKQEDAPSKAGEAATDDIAALEEKAGREESTETAARPAEITDEQPAGSAPAERDDEADRRKRNGATRGVGMGGDGAGPDDVSAAGGSTTTPAGPGSGNAAVPATRGPASSTAAPAAAPEQSEKDWTIVPVYYGTDRARKDQPKRIDYGWERGRRLELGRALVTIPKEHEVPKVERPWAIKIPYTNIKLYEAAEDPKRHFTIQEMKALTREEFLAFVKERLAASSRFEDHAVVFVHGYQTQFDSAVYRTAQITYDMDFDGAAFLYSWPSGGTLQGYTYDRESAAQAEIYLRQFLTMVAQETGAKTVSVIAHSMGNQLVLRVLQDLKRSLPEGLKLSQLILAAPDVDRDSFENIVGSITGIAKGITLYAAANDQALQISRRVNGGVPRAGDVPASGPLVLEGVDTIDATATSMDTLGINHSGYAENNALLNDIKQLIQTGLRPPESRVPTLERITTDRGDYWRYPAVQP